MSVFRYDTANNWYRGNTHIHSTASDGGETFPRIADLYSEAGYDFLFRTDHWVASDCGAGSEDHPLLWLDGIEIDGHDSAGAYFHVVCLGRVEGISREMGFEEALASAKKQGALIIAAHPAWTGNSFDDCLRLEAGGVEIYNHVCRWLNGKGGALSHWNAMLERNPGTLAFASDDAHITKDHPGWNGGWISVNARERSSEEIIRAIHAGNFYSSQGPEIQHLGLEDGILVLETSPVQFVRLAGPGAAGTRIGSFGGDTMTAARIEIPRGLDYVYAEVEDVNGRRAWTNTLFTGAAG